MENNTPGYKTTEFWLSLISVAAILLKLIGIDVNAADQEALAVALASLAAGALAVWGIVSRYVKSRAEVKTASLTAEVTREAAKAGRPVTLNLGGK